MNFRIYAFCQNPLITIFSAVYGALIMGLFQFDLSILPAVLIAVALGVICFMPVISIFYPLLIAVYLILAVIGTAGEGTPHHYICIVMLAVHLIRVIWMVVFVRKNPEKSLEYDIILRSGGKRQR